MTLRWRGSINSLDDLEKQIEGRDSKIYQQFKQPIEDFFSALDKNAHLNYTFDEAEITKLKKLLETSDASFLLYVNAKRFFQKLEKQQKEDLIGKLQEYELIADKNSLAYQLISIFCHTYQVYIEDIKKIMILSIKFDELGLSKPRVRDPYKASLGALLGDLNELAEYRENDFIKHLTENNFLRNAIAHYTYFINNDSKLTFMRKMFGEEESLSVGDFVRQTDDLHILSLIFFLTFLNKFVKAR